MRKAATVLGSLFLCFFLFKISVVAAEEETVAQTEVAFDAGWKQEFFEDRQQLQEQKNEIKDDMEAAKAEEEALKQRIADALQVNDLQTADQLKEELRVMRQENRQEMQQDKEEIQEAKQELKDDVLEVRQAGVLPLKKDYDNNPPGPQGGAGTNWENPPGPRGGPGASPDR